MESGAQGRQLIGTKGSVEKSIYSLYQLFTIMKAANYWYLESISSFDDHSGGREKRTKATDPVVEKGRSYHGMDELFRGT